jgi:spore germination protein YaaH
MYVFCQYKNISITEVSNILAENIHSVIEIFLFWQKTYIPLRTVSKYFYIGRKHTFRYQNIFILAENIHSVTYRIEIFLYWQKTYIPLSKYFYIGRKHTFRYVPYRNIFILAENIHSVIKIFLYWQKLYIPLNLVFIKVFIITIEHKYIHKRNKIFLKQD